MMLIAIKADLKIKKALSKKGIKGDVQIRWVDEHQNLTDADADAFMNLLFEEAAVKENYKTEKPVFLNAVIRTCQELKENWVRLNGWPGFFENESMEIAVANETVKREAEKILNNLGWRYLIAPDIPGLIAPRVISMIINEAYFSLEDKISTKEEINTAMKLGTNYPFGPFEWARKIGLKNIYVLLKKLSASDKRYTIANYLEKEVMGELNLEI